MDPFYPRTIATLALIFVLAFLAETLTEYFARPLLRGPRKPEDTDAEPGTVYPTPMWMRYVAALVGIALTVSYRVDLLLLFGLVPWSPWIGYILTGLIIGRGSNYLHDLVDRWLAPVPKPTGWH